MNAFSAGSEPSHSNPWLWHAWAMGREPDIYGWRDRRALERKDLPIIKDALTLLGGWTPKLEMALARHNAIEEYIVANRVWEERAGPDGWLFVGDENELIFDSDLLSDLNGYTWAIGRGPGYLKLFAYLSPAGIPITGEVGLMHESWKTRDYVTFISMIVGMLALGGFSVASTLGSAIVGPALAAQYPALASAVGQIALATAYSGGDVETAVKNAALNYVAGSAGALVGTQVAAVTNAELLGKVAASATQQAIYGGDVETAIRNTLLQYGVQNMDFWNFGATGGNGDQYSPDPVSEPVYGPEPFDTYSDFDPYAGFDLPSESFSPIEPLPVYEPEYFNPEMPVWEPLPFVETYVPAPVYTAPQFDNWLIPQTEYLPIPEIVVSTPQGANMDPFFSDIYTEDTYGGGYQGEIVDLPAYEYTIPTIDLFPISGQMPNQSTQQSIFSGGNVIGNITALASQALQLLTTAQGLKTVVDRTARVIKQDGSVQTVAADGLIYTKMPDGSIRQSLPKPGVATATIDNGIVVNKGDGSFVKIDANGNSTTGRYPSDAFSVVDRFTQSYLTGDKTPLYLAGAGLAALYLMTSRKR